MDFAKDMNRIKNNKGMTIVEVLVAIGVIVIIFGIMSGLSIFSLRITNLAKETSQANHLATEAMEAVRSFRDGTDWNINGLASLTLAPQEYHPEIINDSWALAPGDQEIDGFNRKIIINEVRRNISGNIVESGGSVDQDSRKITVIVSWKDQEVKIISYLTNWRQ